MAQVKIRRKKVDNNIEKRLITGMIIDDRFLTTIAGVINEDHLEIPYAKFICKWCVNYHKKYAKAPGLHIQHIFERQKSKLEDEQADLIARFLKKLSKDYEESTTMNFDYLLSESITYLKGQSIKNVANDAQILIDNGDVLKAEALLATYNTPQENMEFGIDPFDAIETYPDIFGEEAKQKPLIHFPGALGDLLNEHFTRGKFVSFLGPEKRGKSFLLQECGYRGFKGRNNIAWISAGDMTQDDMMERLMSRVARKAIMKKYSGVQTLSVGYKYLDEDDMQDLPSEERDNVLRNADGSYIQIIKEPVDLGAPLDQAAGIRRSRLLKRRTKGRRFKMATFPPDEINIKGIEALLDIWESRENFIPDIIIIDYMDILDKEPDSDKDMRHAINKTWKAGRALSQRRDALVVSATQADAASYSETSIGRKNFSENKAKFAHVTAMFGLNQTPQEKELGILRINDIGNLRSGKGSTEQVCVIQQLEVSRGYVDSFFYNPGKENKKEERDDD